jgi:hypothetical protein
MFIFTNAGEDKSGKVHKAEKYAYTAVHVKTLPVDARSQRMLWTHQQVQVMEINDGILKTKFWVIN